MAEYRYLAYTKDRKLIHGIQSAATPDIASNILASMDYKVLSIKPLPAFLPRWEPIISVSKRISPRTVIMFSRQWAILIESGLDVVSSLELLKTQTTDRNFKDVLTQVSSDIHKGERLSTALGRHPRVFSKVYVQLISIGEQTGGTESLLRQIADYMEKDVKAAENIKAALRYPVIVSIVGFIVIALLAFYVFPAFTGLYSSLDVELPLLTRITLSVIEWIVDYGAYMVAFLSLAGVVLFFYGKTEKGILQRDTLALKAPLIGRVNHLNELVRCCRNISILQKASVPMADILGITAEGSNNVLIKQSLSHLQQEVLKGASLSQPMAEDDKFLPLMTEMVGVGETTGKLDVTLMAVADSFEEEATAKIDKLIQLIQPAVIVGLGAGVGIVALSLITTMYSMYGQV